MLLCGVLVCVSLLRRRSSMTRRKREGDRKMLAMKLRIICRDMVGSRGRSGLTSLRRHHPSFILPRTMLTCLHESDHLIARL